jgi:hypothetical protein
LMNVKTDSPRFGVATATSDRKECKEKQEMKVVAYTLGCQNLACSEIRLTVPISSVAQMKGLANMYSRLHVVLRFLPNVPTYLLHIAAQSEVLAQDIIGAGLTQII